MAIRLIVDSTCDLSRAEAEKAGIVMLTIKTFFGEEEFPEGDAERFFEKLKESRKLPHTSQVNPYDFEEAYRAVSAAGDEGIVLTISSKLSGTYHSACAALENGNAGGISVVDSRFATFGHRLLLDRALAAVRAGKTRAAVVREIEEAREKLRFYAAVEDLTYLKKGGRINALAFTVANLMAVKPVVHIVDGEIRPRAKKIGFRKAAQEILHIMEQDEADFSHPFYVGYSADPSRAALLSDPILARYGKKPAAILPVGPAVGTYTGPGCVGVAYFVK